MKMVKSLLLGSAAGLVAVVGAQAADLPVKAKPVEYVRICNLYGDGFYYIPGTDTCVKIAGLVWAEMGFNTQNGGENPSWTTISGANDRSTTQFSSRSRADIDFDARSQTPYGTLRSFARFRAENSSGQPGGVANQQGTVPTTAPVVGTGASSTNEAGVVLQSPRAFIQFAGFTFGRVKSLSDGVAQCPDWRLLQGCQTASDTTGGGNNEMTYTWELGNGMTVSAGIADRRVNSITNLSVPGSVSVGATTSFVAGALPTPFVDFRVSQAWGNAALNFIANDNRATYYTAAPGVAGYVPGGACTAQPGSTFCASPSDKWGWSVNASTMINVPWITQGDRLGLSFMYGEGANKYSNGLSGSPALFGGGNNVAVGVLTDAVFVNGAGLQLTTGWSFQGGFEHWFMPNVAFVLYGTIAETKYNNTVVSNGWFCGAGGAATQTNFNPVGGSCDPSFRFWQVIGNLSWYPKKDFRLSVEVEYTGIDTAYSGQPISLGKTQALRPTGIYTAANEHVTSVVFRAQRNWGNDIY